MPARNRNREAEQAVADADWWRAFGQQFGWTLCAFTDRDTAAFRLPGQMQQFQMTRAIRESIEARLAKAVWPTPTV